MKNTLSTTALCVWRKDVQSILIFQCLLLIVLVLIGVIFFNRLFVVNVLLSSLSIFVPSLFLGIWWRYKILQGSFSSNMLFIAIFLKTILSGLCLIASLFVLKDFYWVWQGFFVGLISMVLSPTLCGLWHGFSK